MKYIVVSAIKPSKIPGGENISVIRYPFIFPNNLVHLHVSQAMCLLVSFMHPDYEIKATSGGEVDSLEFQGECFGQSTSLHVLSALGDTNLIRMNDYGAGILEI